MAIIRIVNDAEDHQWCPICRGTYVDDYSPDWQVAEKFGERAVGATRCNCGGFTDFVEDVSRAEIMDAFPRAVEMALGVFSVKLAPLPPAPTKPPVHIYRCDKCGSEVMARENPGRCSQVWCRFGMMVEQ